MTDVFTEVLELAVVSAIITVLLLFFEKLISKRFSAKFYYFAWLVLAVRMMLPFSLPTIEAPVNVKIPDRTVTVTYTAPAQQTFFDESYTDQVPVVGVTIPEDLPPPVIYPITSTPQQPVKENIHISLIACNVWLCGATAVLLYYVIQYCVFRIRLRKHIAVSDKSILGVFDSVCTDLNIKNASVSYFDGAKGPMLVGYLRQMIVLPTDYNCDENTLKLIFTHELTHFKRRDLWYKLFMNEVTAVYWFDPFAWIMRSKAFKAVELSCDCDVVKNQPAEYRGSYSKAILSEVASRHSSSQSYTTYFANDKRMLKERFSYILDMNARKVGITVLCLVIAVSVIVSVIVACDFNGDEQPVNDDSVSADNIDNEVDEYPDENTIVAFSVVCDKDGKYIITGLSETGERTELFNFGDTAILDIDIDNGKLYILLLDEVGYIDLTASKYEYTHLFYSNTYEGYNGFHRFAVHKDRIYFLFGAYDVGDVAIYRVPVTAKSMDEAERYQDCMPTEDVYIDKQNDVFYYYAVETDSSSENIASIYARDMKTNESTRILSDAGFFRYFDGDICSPYLSDNYIFYTFEHEDGKTQLFFYNLSTQMHGAFVYDIKSYVISGKYVYYIDSNGDLFVADIENPGSTNISLPDSFNKEIISIEPFGIDKALVWSLTFAEDRSIEGSVYHVVDSEGNISEYDGYTYSSYPVYLTEPIIYASSSDITADESTLDLHGKQFTELFENVSSYIGKNIFISEMTDEDKFFLAYLFGDCDGSNSEYGDIYPLSYISGLLSSHLSENYASRFVPENVSFYDASSETFRFPTDFDRKFVSEVKPSRYDGILNVYRYNSDGSNLERIYIVTLSPYTKENGEMSWKIDSYYEKLTETSSDLDEIGKELFDIAVMSYGDTYKDFEYAAIVLEDNKTIVVGYGGWYIGFEIMHGENGLGVISAELVDPDEYMIKPKPIEPATE